MSWFFTVLTTATTTFIATNIDDLVILMIFFAQVNQKFRPIHIVIGQYLGFTALILVSIPGFLGGLMIPKTWIGLLGLLPIIIGVKQLLNREEETEVQAVTDVLSVSTNKKSVWASLANFITPQTYHVAAITIANGGDNIGIYVPLFASSDWISLSLILGIFYLLIGVLTFLAYLLTRYPVFAKVLTKYGSAITPVILVGLGIFILIESETYRLLLPLLK